MNEDMLTVMWKEQKSLLRMQGSRARTLLGMSLTGLMLGVALPCLQGRDWLVQAWSLVVAFIVPLFVVGLTVPESFAGERERHTLETLLASRLPDRAILFGKLLFAVACGWGTSLALLIISMISANLVGWTGRFAFYTPYVALADVGVSLLMSFLIGSLGILISLRAASVQAATQTLMFAFMGPLVLMQIGLMVLTQLLPKEGAMKGQAILQRILAPGWTPLLILLGILVLLDVGLMLAAMARFRRARLAIG